MNTKKTRLIVYESLFPVFPGIIYSVNPRMFEIAAVVDDGAGVENCPYPVIPFDKIADTSFWDLFLINDRMLGEQISKILQLLNISPERYVFLKYRPDDFVFYQSLFLPGTPSARHVDFLYRRTGQNYFAISVNGADYLTNAKDECIAREMFFNRKNFSADDIETFINLTEQYYGTSRDTGGYFMDIGANIGTTCIYVKKNLCPNIKIIGFEPIKENFKLLRINAILNDIYDAYFVNAAVSDTCTSHSMVINEFNFGMCSIVNDAEEGAESDMPVETVNSMTIKSFLEESSISASDIKYVWIDTEGFEAEVLSGAHEILSEPGTALYMEYSPGFVSVEKLEMLADICCRHYKSFICMTDYNNGDTTPRPIEELHDFYKSHANQTDLFMIK